MTTFFYCSSILQHSAMSGHFNTLSDTVVDTASWAGLKP